MATSKIKTKLNMEDPPASPSPSPSPSQSPPSPSSSSSVPSKSSSSPSPSSSSSSGASASASRSSSPSLASKHGNSAQTTGATTAKAATNAKFASGGGGAQASLKSPVVMKHDLHINSHLNSNLQREYKGILYKKPTNLSAYLSWSGWRSRYCVADAERLKYYGKKGDPTPRGVIEFADGCKIIRKGKLNDDQLYGFDLVVSGDSTYSFASNSKNDIDTWTNILEMKIRHAAGKKSTLRWRSSSSSIGHRSNSGKHRKRLERGNSVASLPGGNDYMDKDATDTESEEEQDDDDFDDDDGYGKRQDQSQNGQFVRGEERNENYHHATNSANLDIGAVYGVVPKCFQRQREELMCPKVCNNHEGWDLMKIERGFRMFERKVNYAGNSQTDLNGIVSDLIGTVELKGQSIITAPASRVFAMMMDLSKSRKTWDPSFRSGSILETVDLHNDVIKINLEKNLPNIPYLETPRQLVLDRYWCRESNGSYIIYCRSTKTDLENNSGGESSKIVRPHCHTWYITITPTPSYNPNSHCLITSGAKMDLGGWAQFCKPLAKLHVSNLLTCVRGLKSLSENRRVIFGNSLNTEQDLLEDNDEATNELAFDCPLRDALLESGVELSDPRQVVPVLRQITSTLRDLTPHEKAVAKALALMKSSGDTLGKSAQPQEEEEKEKEKEVQEEKSEDQEPIFTLNAEEDEMRTEEQEHEGPLEQGDDGNVFEEQGANSKDEKITMNRKYGMPKNNYILPMKISKDGTSAWWDSGVEKGYWKVRGPNYLKDKVKIPNDIGAMELVQIQWSFYDIPKRNIAMDKDELVQLQHEGRKDRPYMLVINFMVPTVGNYVMYLIRRESVIDAKFDKMLQEFIDGDDKHRNNRFKIIPSVVEGSYFAKKGIGSTPAIIGKKITTQYFKGDNWMEVCIDVGSSRVAGSLMGLVKTYATSLVIDLAFLLESQSDEELPERIMAGCRMHLPLMYPVDDLSKYAKSKEALAEAYKFPPAPVPAPRTNHASVSSKTKEKVGSRKMTEPTRPKVEEEEEPRTIQKKENPSSQQKEQEESNQKLKLDYEYEIPENNFLVPMKLSKSGQSAWWDSGTDIGYWKLRSKSYLVDKLKVPSDISAMELVQVQWSLWPNPKSHISKDPNELIQKQHAGRKNRPFLFVVNFVVPGANFVCYFAPRRGVHDEKFDRMLQEFITKDDEYRNNRFKIIPSVVEGYFVARKAIGSKPAILGRKITTSYFKGDNYFEVCVDVSTSTVAESLLGVVKSYASSMVIDLAFLFESKTEDELPERLLGGFRAHFPLMHPIPVEEFRSNYYKNDPTV